MFSTNFIDLVLDLCPLPIFISYVGGFMFLSKLTLGILEPKPKFLKVTPHFFSNLNDNLMTYKGTNPKPALVSLVKSSKIFFTSTQQY